MKKEYYKVGIIMPSFCDQRYLRDRDQNIYASSEQEAIEQFRADMFKNFFNDDEKRAVQRGIIKIGLIK